MKPLTHFKRIRILPLLVAVTLVVARGARVGYVAARKYRSAVEQVSPRTTVVGRARSKQRGTSTWPTSGCRYDAVVAI